MIPAVPQQLEEWLAFIAAHLSAPVELQEASDGSTYFTGGDPAEVIVQLTRSRITVWEYAATWEGPHTPVVRPIRVGSVVWPRLSAPHSISAVHALIEGARQSRRSKFGTCRYCDRSHPPEFMHDDEVCQGCAVKHLGVVY
jgi:hypothetical protein